MRQAISPTVDAHLFDRFHYPPVGRTERQWDLFVAGAGHVNVPSEYDPLVHPSPFYYLWEKGRVLDDFSILYVTRGCGELEAEEAGHIAVAAGDVFLTFPGVWHRYRALPRTTWSYHWVHFGGGYARHLVKKTLISPERPILQVGLHDALLDPFLQLFQRAAVQPVGYQQLLAANTMEILGTALAVVRQRAVFSPAHPRVEQAKRILQERVEEPIDLPELAASLGIGYHYFRELFKRYTGQSPYQYHLAQRILRAKSLLADSHRTVAEIAVTLGFDDACHFSKMFKAKTGSSPSKWRR